MYYNYHVLSCIIMYYHVLSCVIMYYHVLSCIIMYYHVLSWCDVFLKPLWYKLPWWPPRITQIPGHEHANRPGWSRGSRLCDGLQRRWGAVSREVGWDQWGSDLGVRKWGGNRDLAEDAWISAEGFACVFSFFSEDFLGWIQHRGI